MSYKTFEDMKDKIPDGAVYYQNESEFFSFAWFNATKDKCHFNDAWYDCSMELYPEEQIIKIPDQLDAHLGIADSEEWNGEGLPPVGCLIKTKEGIAKVISTSEEEGGVVTYSWDDGMNIGCSWNNKSWINPIETQQQREERERLETIETMCNEVDKLPHGEAFAAMATLYDLGYRKGK